MYAPRHLPVKTQSVQEGGQTLHEYQNANRKNGPEGKHAGQDDAAYGTLLLQANRKDHGP